MEWLAELNRYLIHSLRDTNNELTFANYLTRTKYNVHAIKLFSVDVFKT